MSCGVVEQPPPFVFQTMSYDSNLTAGCNTDTKNDKNNDKNNDNKNVNGCKSERELQLQQ